MFSDSFFIGEVFSNSFFEMFSDVFWSGFVRLSLMFGEDLIPGRTEEDEVCESSS